MSTNDTEAIDKLFLELSQFTTAKTMKEFRLESQVAQMKQALEYWVPDIPWQDDNPVSWATRNAKLDFGLVFDPEAPTAFSRGWVSVNGQDQWKKSK